MRRLLTGLTDAVNAGRRAQFMTFNSISRPAPLQLSPNGLGGKAARKPETDCIARRHRHYSGKKIKGLDVYTRTLLEQHTAHTPETVGVLNGAWNAILTTLFPAEQGYVVTPRRSRAKHTSSMPVIRVVFEVAKFTSKPLTRRTVLVVKVEDSQDWEHRKEDFIQEIGRWKVLQHLAFQDSGGETRKSYWIGVMGPHWVYGEKEDGQVPKPLIEWHDVTHDDASYQDFLRLVDLVRSLSG